MTLQLMDAAVLVGADGTLLLLWMLHLQFADD